MVKKNLNTKKGITLVALVITIVILIILAGVSLTLVLGNSGILKKTKDAASSTKQATAKEQVELMLADYGVEKYTGNTTLKDYLDNQKAQGKLDAVGEEDSTKHTITVELGGYEITIDTASLSVTDASKIGPRPEVANAKVVTSNDGTGNAITTAKSIDPSTNATLYISFTATLEGGTVSTVKCDNGTTTLTNGIYVTPVTKNGTYTFTLTGSDSSTKEYTVTVDQFKSVLKVGTYVEYNIPYTDMYTSYNFTKTDGWRVLDPGTDNGDGTYTGVKLISTGIPAGLYYYYSDVSNAPWKGTTEQITNYRTAFNITYGAVSDYNMIAAAGLYYNFENIDYITGTTTSTHNQGYVTNVNGTTSGKLNFKTGDAEEVHNLTLEELNTARGNSSTDTTSTWTKDGATGLFYLKKLGTNYGGYSSKDTGYWLAYPDSDNSYSFGFMAYDGDIKYYNGNTSFYSCGLRAVVSLKSGVSLKIIGN